MEDTIDSLHVICNSCLPIYCNAKKIQEVGSIKGTSPCHKSCQKWFPMTRLNLMCLKRQSMDTPNHWRTHLNPFLSIFHSHHHHHHPLPNGFPALHIYKAISLKQLFWKPQVSLKPHIQVELKNTHCPNQPDGTSLVLPKQPTESLFEISCVSRNYI